MATLCMIVVLETAHGRYACSHSHNFESDSEPGVIWLWDRLRRAILLFRAPRGPSTASLCTSDPTSLSVSCERCACVQEIMYYECGGPFRIYGCGSGL